MYYEKKEKVNIWKNSTSNSSQTDRIKEFIKHDTSKEDFVICEIGGIVGDIESLPFVEAIRQFANDVGKKNALFIHLTLVPYLKASDEIKQNQHNIL